MMLPELGDVRVFVRPGPTDMRKSIGTLSILAQEGMDLDPLSGALFVFCNRTRNIMKILYWDRNGFCLWMKKLEKGRFPWPASLEEAIRIDGERLAWLLRGIDFWKEHAALEYSRVV